MLLADSLTDQTAVEQPELARFADVSPDSAHAAALARLHDRGLLNGYADGSYQPDALLTRAEFCVIASTLSDSDSTAGAPVFTDVYQGYWAQAAIEKMAAQNILQGDGDRSFGSSAMETASVSVSCVSRGRSKNRSIARVLCPISLRKEKGISAETRFFFSFRSIRTAPFDCSMCRKHDIIRIQTGKRSAVRNGAY